MGKTQPCGRPQAASYQRASQVGGGRLLFLRQLSQNSINEAAKAAKCKQNASFIATAVGFRLIMKWTFRESKHNSKNAMPRIKLRSKLLSAIIGANCGGGGTQPLSN